MAQLDERITIEICGNHAIITNPGRKGSEDKKTIKIDTLVKAFQEQGTGIATPILPANTVQYKEKGNSAYLVVYFPPAKFDATYRQTKYENCIRPGIIMRYELSVRGEAGYVLSNTYAWSVKDDPLFFTNDTKLFALPFPNVNDSGWVCWGSNSLSGMFKSLTGLGSYIDRLFNAPFNNDLFQGSLFRHVGFDTPAGLFEFLKDKEQWPEELYVDSGRRPTLGSI